MGSQSIGEVVNGFHLLKGNRIRTVHRKILHIEIGCFAIALCLCIVGALCGRPCLFCCVFTLGRIMTLPQIRKFFVKLTL